jgi:DNA mismatch endonuclease (patch repair protein)
MGCPDLAWRGRKVAVFVDGDMWHGNPAEPTKRGRASWAEVFPTRTEWWLAKIERNIERDRAVDAELARSGWRVLRLWESEVLADPVTSAAKVLSLLDRQTAKHSHSSGSSNA